MDHTNQIVCEKRVWEEQRRVHTHDYGHLLFPLKGQLAIQTQHQSVVMNDQKLLYLPSGCEHVFYAQKNWTECLVVDIPSIIASYLDMPDLCHGKILDINPDWQSLRSLMLSESTNEYPALNNLLYYSFHLLTKEQKPLSIQYLRAHFSEPISIETLAMLEHFNTTYYTQWFKKKMHMTPTQYLRVLRLNEAKRLLEETDFSIADITLAVGYSCQSHLSKIFEQSENMPPLAYRIYKQHKKI